MSELKDRLGQAMQRAGKTQSALARACGVTHASVRKWLEGSTRDLAYQNAHKAAAFLNVSLEWLMNGRGSPDAGSVTAVAPDQELPDDLVQIPEFRIRCGAGPGPDAFSYEEVKGVRVVSENPAIPPAMIEDSEFDRFVLIGRVVDRSGSSPF